MPWPDGSKYFKHTELVMDVSQYFRLTPSFRIPANCFDPVIIWITMFSSFNVPMRISAMHDHDRQHCCTLAHKRNVKFTRHSQTLCRVCCVTRHRALHCIKQLLWRCWTRVCRTRATHVNRIAEMCASVCIWWCCAVVDAHSKPRAGARNRRAGWGWVVSVECVHSF